jgi:hypothetical protein
MNWKSWNKRLVCCAVVASMSLLTGCWHARPVVYITGTDYLHLQKGQTFTAPQDMTLATEKVIQEKDERILDLIRVNRQLQAQIGLK